MIDAGLCFHYRAAAEHFYDASWGNRIEAVCHRLEAILAACRQEVLTRMPPEGEGVPTVDEMAEERRRMQAELDTRATQERAGVS